MQTTQVSSSNDPQRPPQPTTEADDGYADFLNIIGAKWGALAATKPTLFYTNVTGLKGTFLDNLPRASRPTYRCNACEKFLDRYGALVVIRDDGARVSALWDEEVVPPVFKDAVKAMRRAVEKADIEGVFLSEERVWGLPSNIDRVRGRTWLHMFVRPANEMVFKVTPLKNAGQRAAEVKEEHDMLCRGLAEFPVDIVRQAHTALTNGQLYRSEKCIGVAKWLLDLHEQLAAVQGKSRDGSHRRDNLIWRAVATAPVGFAHVRSGMIGTLLEDIQSGLPFADVKAKFDAKMHPLAYQRPQAAPSAGNITQAEKVVAALRTAGSLVRRFARLEDVQAWVWQPSSPRKDTEGRDSTKSQVFGHLYGAMKGSKTPSPVMAMPPVVMTWAKFRREVLPGAHKIEYRMPLRANLASLVTASNPTAPPIVQWDTESHRNSVTWFLYAGGRPASHWNLTPGWVPVTGVTMQPTMWDGQPREHLGESVFFLLEGAWDKGHMGGGGLFPEHLKSDYHAVRSTIEAHFRSARIEEADQGTATGYKFEKSGNSNDLHVRVTSGSVVTEYKIDRWD